MKGRQKISLAMALLTVMGSAQPIFAFTPAKEETKKAIVSKADAILTNPAIQKHLLGTDYLAPKHNSTYTPGIDLSDYEDVEGKGKLYGKDGYILTPDQLKATHWYEIYSLATRAKEHVNSLDQNVADRLLDELNMVLQIYALNSSPQLKDDGDYTGTYRLVDVQLISQDGQTNVYQNLGTEKQDVKDLFQEMEVVKWGNELEVLFVANQKKVSKINSMLIKNVAGKEIRVSLGSGDAQDPTKTNLVAIPIPAELDGSQLVVEGMTYVDNQGVTQKTGKFGIDIDYKNMKKSSSNYKRYEKKTKARIKYWIKRGDILIGSYLDSRAPKDLEKIKTIRQSIVKLNALRNSDAPSMTEALKYAQPIYETENEFTLREILSGYIHVALEDLKSGTIYNEKKYTKESLDAFKTYLEKLQKDAADMNVVQLVAAISDVQSAGQNQVLKYTTKKLDKLLKKAEKYEAAYYEEESFLEFKTAEVKAKKWVEANKTYSPALDETEDHCRLLEKAIANLKAKPGMTPPEIKDDDAKKPSKAIYEVPVTCRDTAIMRCLDGPVKYIPSEKKYIFSFKKDGDNFVKEAKSNTSNYVDKTGTVTETAGEESGHKIAKTIEFIDPDNSLGMYLHVKYYNAERLGIEEKPNVQFTLDMDKKKLLGGAEEKPETDPYDVKVSYENQNGAGKTYMEQLVSDKVTYDPVKKTLTFTAMPEMAGAKVKSYVAMINYATGGTYKPADITKKEERELVAESASERVSIPKTFVMNYDIARGDTINVNTDIVIGHTNKDKQKTGDIVRLHIKKAESKTGEEELKLLSDTLAKRRSELKVNAAAVDKLLPEVIKVGGFFESPEEAEQSSRQVAIKEAVKELLQQSEKVNEKDAEQIRRTIQQLDNLSEAILPWVSLSNTFHGAEKNLEEYKSDGHFTKASLEKIEGIIKGVRDQMNAPMERERVAQNHDTMLSVYEYLRLDYTELEELINEAEQKINSGKYQDAGVKALREILYGYNGKERAIRRAHADDAFNPGQMQPMVLRNSHGAKAYLAEVKGDDVSGANLDTSLYDSWVYYIKEALKDLKEKQAGDVTKTALEDAIQSAEKALEKNKSDEAKKDLMAAITKAKAALESTDQAVIDRGVDELNAAVKAYEATKDVFKTEELEAEIAKAESLVKGSKKEEAVTKKLSDAIEEAKKSLKATSQEAVDNAYKALKAEVAAFQEAPDKADPHATVEAIKTVNIQLFKEKQDILSMANSALWNQGKLTKENGKWYLEMQWVDMTTGDNQSTGAITELTYTIKGEKKKAQVLAEHEVTIGKNKFTSPTRVKIEVTENERFVPVTVSYKTSLGPEVHSPEARIAIDWQSATDGFDENTFAVDKGQLIDACKVYEILAKSARGVNEHLIQNLNNSLKKAKSVIDNHKATLADVKEAYNDLDKAGSAVKFADEISAVHLAQLEANLREFKQEQGKYTADSIAKYEAVITRGKKALQNAKTYEEIKEAYDAIKTIDDQLRYDTSALEAKVKVAEAMMAENYTQASKDNLDVKIQDAKKWIQETEKKGIKAGYLAENLTKALDAAMKGMVKEGEAPEKADKTKLLELICECEGLDLSKYTDESKTEFEKKLNEAKTVASDDAATKEDVADALNDLKAAKEGLVEKQAPKEQVTVTFMSDKGTSPAAVTVDKGMVISAPAGFEEGMSKVKEGDVTYVFKGWYDGNEKFDFTKPVNGNKTLTARWEKMEVPADQEAIYNVEFSWKKMNSDDDAMMGKVFKHPAQLIVKGDKAFFRVELQDVQDVSDKIYVTDMAYKGETLVPSKTTEVTVGGVTQTKPAAYDIPVDMNDVNKTFRLTVTVGAKGMPGKASADFVVDGGGKTLAQPAPQVDKKALNQLIAECEALDLKGYEEKGKNGFITALKDAKAVSEKSTATKEDVELALTKLQQAKGALVQKKTPKPEEKPDAPKPDVKPDTQKPDVKPGYSGGRWYFSPAPSKPEGKQTEPGKSQKNEESPKTPEANFSDTVNHWAKEPINYVVSKGYFKGVGDNRFAPERSITRADFVTVLGRMAGIDQSKFTKNAFKDVHGGYYAAYVNWASEKGIVQGVGNGKFDPNRPITREEMAVMMNKFLQVTNKKLSEKESKVFTDGGTIAPWAKEAVGAMAKKGIVKGMEDGSFRPKSGFTRAQVAQVLYNMDHNK